ncbi:UNVERIFIED_CONTAM: hypothetical protein Slati_4201400 [Sesamum latifolium]|uniref:Uncharacterized protein n=1 Tax=Sesamum latifolium TaxID=2727402 RepID=A0AAW2TBD1_9LAMI
MEPDESPSYTKEYFQTLKDQRWSFYMDILREGDQYLQIPNDGSSENQEYFHIVERQRKNFIFEVLDWTMTTIRWEPEPLTKEEQEEWWRVHQIRKMLPGNTVKGLQEIQIHGSWPVRKTNWVNTLSYTALKIMGTDWKELELDTSKISQDLREIQKMVQNYGHRLIYMPMKIETLNQKMDKILKILLDLHKGLTDLKTEVVDIKRNQRDNPEASKSRQERSGTPLELCTFYTRRERRWRFQSQTP